MAGIETILRVVLIRTRVAYHLLHLASLELKEALMNREGEANDSERLVHVMVGPVTLEGNIYVPSDARRIVLLAHGSGSSRHSPRNRFIASVLQQGGLATLLIDLLTADEERIDAGTAHLRFDIDLLAERLAGAAKWLTQQPDTRELRIGCFGASTGGGAALLMAAQHPERVAAVVCPTIALAMDLEIWLSCKGWSLKTSRSPDSCCQCFRACIAS
jgi:pimeloyl-ACP methyl ester carboxylesterase